MFEMIPQQASHFRFSKLLRDGLRGDVFSPGASLPVRRVLDGDQIKGRHEGRGRKTSEGSPRLSLSSALQQRTGRANKSQGREHDGRQSFDPRQRAMVKVHYFGHGGGGGGALRAHARYVARDAAARDHGLEPALHDGSSDEPERVEMARTAGRERGRAMSVFYDALSDGVEGGALAARWASEDRRHFRLILSAENGARLAELRSYTREVMRRAELVLGTRLEWIAVDHWDTDNPHTHIILRGRTDDGRDLFIHRDFVCHGFRNAARDVATERLGSRGRDDERLALQREARAQRLTRLDRMIEVQLDQNQCVRVSALEAPHRSPDVANALKARVHELHRLGLAREIARNVFELTPGWQEGLKALELHLDIRKSLLRARTHERAAERQLSQALRLSRGLER